MTSSLLQGTLHFNIRCPFQKGATLETPHLPGNAQRLMEETYSVARVPHLCPNYPIRGRLRSVNKDKTPGVTRVGARLLCSVLLGALSHESATLLQTWGEGGPEEEQQQKYP